MRSGNLQGAMEDQEDALSQLERAQASMAQQLAAAQRQQREETLQKLARKLYALLAEQEVISLETQDIETEKLETAASAAKNDTEDVPIGNVDPEAVPDEEALTKVRRAERTLARRERILKVDVEDVVRILDEEGSSVVAPRLLERVQDDLDNVATLLAEGETGEVTQMIHADIESSMRGVLDAFKEKIAEERKRREEEEEAEAQLGRLPGGGGMPMPEGKEVIPPSREVRMLVAEQARLRRRTVRLAELGLLTPPDSGDARASDEPEAPEQKGQAILFDQARRLATVEEALSTLTEAFMEKYKMVDPLLLGLDPRERDEDQEGARDGLPGDEEAVDDEANEASTARDKDFDFGVEKDEEDTP